ncbi:MAG: hypothetical protein WDN06_17860 [Asticcacaulis sp.]
MSSFARAIAASFALAAASDADIKAKGDRSWTQYRLDTMREVSQDLVLGPAKTVTRTSGSSSSTRTGTSTSRGWATTWKSSR